MKGWALFHHGEASQAADVFSAARSIRRTLEDMAGEAAALHGQAAALRRIGESQIALELAERGVMLVEAVRTRRTDSDLRTEYFSSVQALYELCVDLLMERHAATGDVAMAQRAFHIHERSRARSLLDRMGLRGRAQDPRPDSGEHDPSALTTAGGEPLSVEDVQRALDADTTVLVYGTGASRSSLWLIERQDFKSYELPPAAIIDRGARRLLAAISIPPAAPPPIVSGRSSQTVAAAVTLARMILPEDAVRRIRKRIVFVPSGPLQLVPLGVLPPSPREQDGTILPDRHEIVTLPSASIIGSLRRADWWSRPQKTLAVFADPVLHASDARVRERVDGGLVPAAVLPRLLGTRWEAREIGRLVPADRQLLALDFDAARSTLQRLDLSKYRILHFSTHAVVDERHAERSGLVLSTVDDHGRAVDGFIRADEILKWRLAADLVVLSGCRTAVGRDVRGEGLMALSRGFLAAGASRLVTTLWAVDDNASAELIKRLYQGMLGPEHATPAAALRAAQLHMRASPRWHSSYFWSGFVLQGEWR